MIISISGGRQRRIFFLVAAAILLHIHLRYPSKCIGDENRELAFIAAAALDETKARLEQGSFDFTVSDGRQKAEGVFFWDDDKQRIDYTLTSLGESGDGQLGDGLIIMDGTDHFFHYKKVKKVLIAEQGSRSNIPLLRLHPHVCWLQLDGQVPYEKPLRLPFHAMRRLIVEQQADEKIEIFMGRPGESGHRWLLSLKKGWAEPLRYKTEGDRNIDFHGELEWYDNTDGPSLKSLKFILPTSLPDTPRKELTCSRVRPLPDTPGLFRIPRSGFDPGTEITIFDSKGRVKSRRKIAITDEQERVEHLKQLGNSVKPK